MPYYNPLRINTFQQAMLACLPFLALAAAGCVPASADKTAASEKNEETVAQASTPRRSAEVMLGKKPPAPAGRNLRQQDAETAYYRDQYKKNRTVPPSEFAVKPSRPKNNNYGEFEEELYASLDTQPRLPGMPGGRDLMPMMGGPVSLPVAPGDYPQHRTQGGDFHSYPPQSRTGSSAPASAPRRSMSAATAQTIGAAGAGLMTEERFYPIEQLVFGGEFPDLDKPELYRLMPKDIVSITVKDHPEFSTKLEIQPDGTIRIPNLPDLIRLRGLTVDEASEELRQALQVYVKGECVVRVQTNRARGGYYFVFGDVLQPGRFPMGLEPIKLSDAVLAANWETNLARVDADGDELGPAFPTATPRGKFIAPRTADMANVMLVTPHRSKPVRTTHDVRQAMLGIMREDPVVRPGQIIIVPSLDPRRNASLGIDMPAGERVVQPGGARGGFSRSGTPARLPDVGAGSDGYGYGVQGAGHDGRYDAAWSDQAGADDWTRPEDMMDCLSPVQRNMANTFGVQSSTQAAPQYEQYVPEQYYYEGSYGAGGACEATETVGVPAVTAREWSKRKLPESAIPVPGTEVPSEQYAESEEYTEAEEYAEAEELADDFSAMAASPFYEGKRPKTDVRGVADKDGGQTEELVELRTRRGRRLPRPADAAQTEKAGKTKKDPGNWKMGF